MFGRRHRKSRKRLSGKVYGIDRPVNEYQVGSVTVQTWNRESRFRKKYRVISVGRWSTNGRKMWLSKYLYPSDIEDLLEILLTYQKDLTKR